MKSIEQSASLLPSILRAGLPPAPPRKPPVNAATDCPEPEDQPPSLLQLRMENFLQKLPTYYRQRYASFFRKK